ncbi:hypothetical protein BCR33DRAFT_735658 [Rhizoclosmatium globosum]|uniref:PH domain-containing protein n=1 Tax=Rhizoclosmatium globosum TaxID=329046 RepID=A0A1Y2CMA7_9FUNG|nr:hypothetical protein BCR33DRAFT_735658 [Rhizoclosmatium globosum]|eukprot:ORY48161.1 hypothetical protein BCR33DRAFT_735658 [Rhizoclosmatium globosum]
MKDLTSVAQEITAISAGGPTNWAILAQDSIKSIKILQKGTKGVSELRETLAKSTASPGTQQTPLVALLHHNNIPLKIRLTSSKPSLALAKHHDVKILLKHHVAVLDVADIDKDLTGENVERVVESVSPASSPVSAGGPAEEEALEGKLNDAFAEEVKQVEGVKREVKERLDRISRQILEEEKENLAGLVKGRGRVDELKKELMGKSVLFEGWLAVRVNERAIWKVKWARIEGKKLTLYRDETMFGQASVIGLAGAQFQALKEDGVLPNSFEIAKSAEARGVAFYTESKDLLYHMNAAIEISA